MCNLSDEDEIKSKLELLINDPIFYNLVECSFKDVNISMCCTGGVRCEKSTAFMKMLGFTNV